MIIAVVIGPFSAILPLIDYVTFLSDGSLG